MIKLSSIKKVPKTHSRTYDVLGEAFNRDIEFQVKARTIKEARKKAKKEIEREISYDVISPDIGRPYK